MELHIDREAWDEMMRNAVGASLRSFLVHGGENGTRRLGGLGVDFDVDNPEIAAWLETYTMAFARRINDTTERALRESLSEGLSAGESIPELQARMRDILGEAATDYRAEMVARTESHRASQHGELEAWKQSGVVIARVWRANPAACDFCLSMDGVETGIHEEFIPQGGAVVLDDGRSLACYEAVETAHLHPNCTCSTDPVLITD